MALETRIPWVLDWLLVAIVEIVHGSIVEVPQIVDASVIWWKHRWL